MRIFVAGATGLIGVRLVPLLVEAGHEVAGMTRSPDKAGSLRDLGAEPVICDVFDAEAVAEAVDAYAPDSVFHQLTDLPDHVADMASFGSRNDRIRSEGTHNLLAAAVAAGAEQFIAQSIAWDQADDARRAVTAAHEHTVLQAGGVVIRYGQFWGPGTYYETTPPARPRIHVDDAARLTVASLEVPAGVTMVIDDRAAGA
ncbi:MAG: NAD-dependent epimerase/dehydratase family protein [Streptosporangiaceae bacterium]|jgi:nucleoside-diphosphate-sugar epimerase